MARPRSAGRRDLPENLVPRHRKLRGKTVTYWYWKDPRDGKEKSLKCQDDRPTAIRRARELNNLVSRETAEKLVVELSRGAVKVSDVSFQDWANRCVQLAMERGLADNTIKTRKSLTNSAIKHFSNRSISDITVSDITTLLNTYIEQGKNRSAKAMRSMLIDVWREAIREGVLPSGHHNPAEIAREPIAKVKRARLVLDDFFEILAAAEWLSDIRGAWIKNSLLLALVTGQRREDIAVARFKAGRTWTRLWQQWIDGQTKKPPHPFVDNDFLWVPQRKTGSLVKIPLLLKLDAVNLSVGQVIDYCRQTGVASQFLLHHTKPFGNCKIGSQVHADTISRAFAQARSMTKLNWPGKTPPTFHEIRSLSERLYCIQGIDTQVLLGHRSAKMTRVYNDPRQAEWGEVKLQPGMSKLEK